MSILRNVESNTRMELGDFVTAVAEANKLEYAEAELLLPSYFFENGHLCDDDEFEWAIEIVKEMKQKGIASISIYQD